MLFRSGAEEGGGGEGVGEREQGGWCFLNFHSLHKPNTQTQAFLHTHTHLSEHAIHLARYTWPKVHIAEEVLSDWVGGRELGCGQIRAYWSVETTGEVTGDRNTLATAHSHLSTYQEFIGRGSPLHPTTQHPS